MTTTSELRSRLERKQEEISEIAHQVEDRIESFTHWDSIVRDYPLQSVGIAVGAGLLLTGAGAGLLRFVGKQAGTVVQTALVAYAANMLGKVNESKVHE